MAPEFGKPIHQLPLIPTNVLKKHRVHEPLDTRFRSAARLLEALWREDPDALPRENELNLLGPAEAPIAVIRGRHRFRLLVRGAPAGCCQRNSCTHRAPLLLARRKANASEIRSVAQKHLLPMDFWR